MGGDLGHKGPLVGGDIRGIIGGRGHKGDHWWEGTWDIRGPLVGGDLGHKGDHGYYRLCLLVRQQQRAKLSHSQYASYTRVAFK